MSSLESFVYPIDGSLDIEINDVGELGCFRRVGEAVKIGRTEWCLLVHTVQNKSSENHKVIGVYLHPLYDFENDENIEVECKFTMLDSRKMEMSCEFNKGCTSKGYTNVAISKTGRLCIEAELQILSENLRSFKTSYKECRPNKQDLKLMLAPEEYEEQCGRISKEVHLGQLSKDENFSDTILIDGIPWTASISKWNFSKDRLLILIYCNPKDESDFFRVEAYCEIRILNRKNPESHVIITTEPETFSKYHDCISRGYDKWSELTDPKNGFIQGGKISIEIFIFVRNKYGFGVGGRMRRMTDAVIKIDNERFYVSRSILSHQSSLFCNLFSGNPHRIEFVLEDVNKELFIKFLELVHDGRTIVDEDNIEKLLKSLRLLHAEECIRRCDSLMVDMDIKDESKVKRILSLYDLPRFEAKHTKKPLKSENPISQPYYTYSPRYPKLPDTFRPAGKFRMNFIETARMLLEDPKMKDVGNEVLIFLSEKSETMRKVCSRVCYQEFSDPRDMVIFEVEEDGKIFYSSKQILAHASRYFMKLFYGPDSYKNVNIKVSLKDISSEKFHLLLNHIYHPTTPITDQNVETFLHLARRFSVTSLLNECERFLLKSECESTSISISKKWELGRDYELEYLKEAYWNHYYEENNKNQKKSRCNVQRIFMLLSLLGVFIVLSIRIWASCSLTKRLPSQNLTCDAASLPFFSIGKSQNLTLDFCSI